MEQLNTMKFCTIVSHSLPCMFFHFVAIRQGASKYCNQKEIGSNLGLSESGLTVVSWKMVNSSFLCYIGLKVIVAFQKHKVQV